MKRTVIIAALLLTSISLFAQSGRSFYQKYSDEPGVTAVYISPAMFRMIGSIPDITAGDSEVNLAPVISSLNGMYILSSENQAVNSKLYKEVTRALSSGNYELLMEAKDDGETVRIYGTSSEDGSLLQDIALLAGDALIFIRGTIRTDQVVSLIEQADRD